MGQYKGGKGDDIETILSMYDGAPLSILRADESKNVDLVSCILAISGTIQPTVLQRLMKDDVDGNGQWARICWAEQGLAKATLPDSGKIELTPLVTDIYRKIDALSPTTYKLSPQAWKLFQKEYDRLEDRRIESANKSVGLSSCYGKAEGRLARLALNLHLVWEVAAGKTPSESISAEVMQKAIALNRYYLAQVIKLYSAFHTDDSLAPDLQRVLEWAKAQDWLKVRDVQQRLSTKQKQSIKAENIRLWFSELAEMGLGVVRGTGRTIEFSVNGGDGGYQPPKQPPSQTIENIGLQPLGGDGGDGGDFPKKVEQPEKIVVDVGNPAIEAIEATAPTEPSEISSLEKQPTSPPNAPMAYPVEDVAGGDEPTKQPPNEKQPPKFAIGDEVQIIGGDHVGARGTITRMDEADPLRTYEVTDIHHYWTDWLPASDLSALTGNAEVVEVTASAIPDLKSESPKPEPQPESKAQPESGELKIGDSIEILVGTDAGQRGLVVGHTDFMTEIQIPGDAEPYQYFADQLRKV